MPMQFCILEWQEEDLLQCFLQLHDTSSTRKVGAKTLAVISVVYIHCSQFPNKIEDALDLAPVGSSDLISCSRW